RRTVAAAAPAAPAVATAPARIERALERADPPLDLAELGVALLHLLEVVKRLPPILELLVGDAELEVEAELLAFGDALDVQGLLELTDGFGLLALLAVAQPDHGVAQNLAAGCLHDHSELVNGIVVKAHFLVRDAKIVVGFEILFANLLLHDRAPRQLEHARVGGLALVELVGVRGRSGRGRLRAFPAAEVAQLGHDQRMARGARQQLLQQLAGLVGQALLHEDAGLLEIVLDAPRPKAAAPPPALPGWAWRRRRGRLRAGGRSAGHRRARAAPRPRCDARDGPLPPGLRPEGGPTPAWPAPGRCRSVLAPPRTPGALTPR